MAPAGGIEFWQGGQDLARDNFQCIVFNGGPLQVILANGILAALHTAPVNVAAGPRFVVIDIHAGTYVNGLP
jgi:hypothetical protein